MAALFVLLLAVPLQPSRGTPRTNRAVAAYQLASLAEGLDLVPFPRCFHFQRWAAPCRYGGGSDSPRRRPDGWITGRDTFEVGTWRGRALALHVLQRTIGWLGETHLRLVDAEADSTLARLHIEGESWSDRIWSECLGEPLVDLDGNGLRDVMVATMRGGGPYSVNVVVQAVHVIPEAGGLVERWPVLTAPRVDPEAGTVRTQERFRNFGRSWSVGRHRMVGDTLAALGDVGYRILDDAMLEDPASALYARARLRGHELVAVDTLRGDAIPRGDLESYACPE